MTHRRRIVLCMLVAGILGLWVGTPTSAQLPEKFTNLQYFPKDIDREQLIQTMRGFSFSVGVRCEYCHAAKDADPPEKRDYASDEKEPKKTARAMLRMVDAINQEYIAKLGSQTQNRVSCDTCHHAISKPRTINSMLAETLSTKGIPEAVAQYKELRKNYYGGAQYDFTVTPLNILSEGLLRSGKGKEAVAMMEMNLELNGPFGGWSNSVLAMSHMANKDFDKAKADFQRILEKDPQNKWAKEQLDKLNQSPH